MMKNLIFMGLLLLGLSSCTLRSNLYIAGQETFVLGGNGNGAFRTRLVNTGDMPIAIGTKLADGSIQLIDTLQPGQRAHQRFEPGSAALLTNILQEEGVVQVLVKGDLKLGMVYERPATSSAK